MFNFRVDFNSGWIDFLGFVDFKWVYHYILVVNEKKKMSSQLKIGHIINLLAIYIPNKRRLTKRPMVRNFETLETISAHFKR